MATISPYGLGDFGGDLGKSLGTGLGSSLQALSQMKLQEMMQQRQRAQTAKGFEALGLPGGLSYLDPKSQQALLRGWSEEGGLQGLLGSLQQSGMPQAGMAELMQQQGISQQGQQMQQPPMGQGLSKPGLEQQTQTMKVQEPWQILNKKPIGKTQKALYDDARKEQHYIDKQTLPYRESLDKKGGSLAKMSDMYLDRMSKLIDQGKLPYAAMHNLRKGLEKAASPLIGAGLGAAAGSVIPALGTVGGAIAGATLGGKGHDVDLGFIEGKEAQEFTKLGLEFMSRMKDIFGGKVSDREVQTFLSSIPNLSQTDEGKKAIIRNMKLTLDAWKYKKKVMDNVIKEHGGYVPRNIEEIVEAKSEPYMTDIAKRFVEGD